MNKTNKHGRKKIQHSKRQSPQSYYLGPYSSLWKKKKGNTTVAKRRRFTGKTGPEKSVHDFETLRLSGI